MLQYRLVSGFSSHFISTCFACLLSRSVIPNTPFSNWMGFVSVLFLFWFLFSSSFLIFFSLIHSNWKCKWMKIHLHIECRRADNVRVCCYCYWNLSWFVFFFRQKYISFVCGACVVSLCSDVNGTHCGAQMGFFKCPKNHNPKRKSFCHELRTWCVKLGRLNAWTRMWVCVTLSFTYSHVNPRKSLLHIHITFSVYVRCLSCWEAINHNFFHVYFIDKNIYEQQKMKVILEDYFVFSLSVARLFN